MQVRFFTIPVHGGEDAADQLNRFIASHRVVAIDREFVQDGANSLWAVSVTVVQADSRPQPAKKPRVDYKEVLSDADFAVFAKLREVRKTLAEAEGVPAYAVFTNEQLAAMVQQGARSTGGLRAIDGIGEARATKYGEPFLAVLRQAAGPTSLNGGGRDEA